MIEWNFPSNNGGQINGIANAGIETFNGRLIQSITRENCQNSLDAAKNENEKVIVKFTSKKINSNLFPGREVFLQKLKKALEYWKKNEKAKTFLEKALFVMEKDEMDVLIISDYNTTGLLGAYSNDIYSPWSSLTKLDGGATKSGNTGGSYGIGKNAPFANSNFRTVFYRTRNSDNEIASQGIARIISYPEDFDAEMDTMTTGVGYYGNSKGNIPVNTIAELDQIESRQDIGTDVFIFGFNAEYNDNYNWKLEIIEEILKNFIVAVFNEKLVVYVDGYEISKKMLKKNIDAYIKGKSGQEYKSCYSNFLVLNSSNTKIYTQDFHGLGKLEFKLLIDPSLDLDRKILRVRKTGMKLFNRSTVSKAIMYSGILELKGDEIGKYFLKLEPPTHDKWEFDRADKKFEAKSYIKEIETWEANIIQENGLSSDVQEFSVEGLNELLSFEGNFKSTEKKESLNDSIDKISIVQSSKKNALGKLYSGNGNEENIKDKVRVRGTLDKKGKVSGVRTLIGNKKRQNTNKYKAFPNRNGKDIAIISNPNVTSIDIENIRILNIDECKYKLVFSVPIDVSKGYIDILTIGENNSSKKICIKQFDCAENLFNVRIEHGSIYFTNVKANTKLKIVFDVFDNRNYAMEVAVYEHF